MIWTKKIQLEVLSQWDLSGGGLGEHISSHSALECIWRFSSEPDRKKHHSFLQISSDFPLSISWISTSSGSLIGFRSQSWVFTWRDAAPTTCLTPAAYNIQHGMMDSKSQTPSVQCKQNAYKSRRPTPSPLTPITSVLDVEK